MNIADKISTRLPPDITRLSQDLARLAGKQRAALVGGVIRDLLLNRPVLDADLMLEPPAGRVVEDLARLHNATVVSHPRFMTFTLHFPTGRKIDIVTAREETYAAPAALPRVTAATIEKDLARRDFSVNAIACFLNPDTLGTLLDPFDGQADIAKKLVRALHPASFEDDPTRIYRAARFAGRLGFQVEEETKGWIQAAVAAGGPSRLSAVRRRHEFEAILREEDPLPALILLKSWDALRLLHPDWDAVDLKGLAADFRQVPAASRDELLARRLALWFKSWDASQRTAIMGDLGFEKFMKRRVQALLDK